MFISFPTLLNCSTCCGFPRFYGFRGMFFTQIVWFYTLSMFFTATKVIEYRKKSPTVNIRILTVLLMYAPTHMYIYAIMPHPMSVAHVHMARCMCKTFTHLFTKIS